MEQFPGSIEPQGMFEGLRPGPILVGAVVDNIATLFSFAILVVWLGYPETLNPDQEAANRAIEASMSSPEFLLGTLILGFACTVLGGYVGARRAGRLHLRHGGWVAVISAALGLVFYVLPSEGPGLAVPLWHDVAGWVLLIPAGLLGGAIAMFTANTSGA